MKRAYFLVHILSGGTPPGELFFIRGAASRSPLKFTVSGQDYAFTHFKGCTLVALEGHARKRLKDTIRITSTPHDLTQTVEVHSTTGARVLNLRALRTDDVCGDWKMVEIKDARVDKATLQVHLLDTLNDVHVEGVGKKVDFSLKIQERKNHRIASKRYNRLSAEISKPFILKKRKG